MKLFFCFAIISSVAFSSFGQKAFPRMQVSFFASGDEEGGYNHRSVQVPAISLQVPIVASRSDEVHKLSIELLPYWRDDKRAFKYKVRKRAPAYLPEEFTIDVALSEVAEHTNSLGRSTITWRVDSWESQGWFKIPENSKGIEVNIWCEQNGQEKEEAYQTVYLFQ